MTTPGPGFAKAHEGNGVTCLEGKLKTWNSERGFGFIASSAGGADVFVHIKALPRDGTRPIVGEILTFDLQTDRDGRIRATNVRRPGIKARATMHPGNQSRSRPGPSLVGRLLPLTIVLGLGAYAYSRYQDHAITAAVSDESATLFGARSVENATRRSTFKCDGRTMCSQMTSCAEAEYFLKNCPGVQMDGNHDGEPCEQQWCN